MAHSTAQGARLLTGVQSLRRFDTGLGRLLPEAYKKFWIEWKVSRPVAVHFIPKEGHWERDLLTGEMRPIQNIPLPYVDPPEANEGIWGGESIIKGFQKRQPLKRRVPHFWVPVLRRSVMHSRVLNEYMSIVVTDRTIEQVHDCHGFDHYILKNPACDLRSTLALRIKRLILTELLEGCPTHVSNKPERDYVMKEYSCYLQAYTPEEIEWYGHTFEEAIQKLQKKLAAANPIVPHKQEFRNKLFEQLKETGVREMNSQAAPAPTVVVAKPQETIDKVEQKFAKLGKVEQKFAKLDKLKTPQLTIKKEKADDSQRVNDAEIKAALGEDKNVQKTKTAFDWLKSFNPFSRKNE